MSALQAISPIDGRYGYATAALSPYFSESALIHYRSKVEIEWLKAMLEVDDLLMLEDTASAKTALDQCLASFDAKAAERVKSIEQTTNHDVKAVEYYLREKIQANPILAPLSTWIHFGCTSEDINNLAYALMLKDALADAVIPAYQDISNQLSDFAKRDANLSMLSRTHGQSASPTTLGKEWRNVHHRIERELTQLQGQPIYGKFNGAVGNFNAHSIAFPDIDWPRVAEQFVSNLGLTYNSHTTQIEPHDGMAAVFHNLSRLNTILLDLSRDLWGYISLGYFLLKLKEGEVGSSTMPHKVNPIDFENAEGNCGLANALLNHLAQKLPVSRWQRDLSDSTVLRSMGSGIAHGFLACHSMQKGLGKLAPCPQVLAQDLNDNPAVLGEAIQMVMRAQGADSAYEQLKALTRGQVITTEILAEFIQGLDLPDPLKQQLTALTPESYIGYAQSLAKESPAHV